jgi:hypothetical protein
MLAALRALPLSSYEQFAADPRNPAAAESFLRRGLEALLDLGRHVLAKRFGRATTEYREIARCWVRRAFSTSARRRSFARWRVSGTVWCTSTTRDATRDLPRLHRRRRRSGGRARGHARVGARTGRVETTAEPSALRRYTCTRDTPSSSLTVRLFMQRRKTLRTDPTTRVSSARKRPSSSCPPWARPTLHASRHGVTNVEFAASDAAKPTFVEKRSVR